MYLFKLFISSYIILLIEFANGFRIISPKKQVITTKFMSDSELSADVEIPKYLPSEVGNTFIFWR